MKSAVAHERKQQILLQASSETTDGVGLQTGPCIVVLADCTDEELGTAVRLALLGSKHKVPHPVDWRTVPEPMLEAAGVKSWTTFARDATCVGIEQEGDILRMIPTVNLAPKGGYQDLTDKQITASAPSDQQVGSMLREAFARTE